MAIYLKTHKRKLGVKNKFMGVKQVYLLISGDVQGVGYRYFARSVASKYNLTGYVKNLHNGKVEAVLEGEDENIFKAVDEFKKGPVSSKVTSIDIQWKPATSFYNSFSISF